MSSSSSTTGPTLALLPNWLGDGVMALPALAALRERGPLWVCGAPALIGLLGDAGLCDGQRSYDRRGADAGLGGLWRVGSQLRALRPARTVAFPPSLRAGILAWWSGAPRRSGFPGEGRRFLLNDRWPPPHPAREHHLADQWLAMVKGEGLVNGAARPALRPGPRAEEALGALRAELPALPAAGRYVALAPGATYGPTKRWDPERFAALGRHWRESRGWGVVVVGGSDPAERALVERVAEGAGGLGLAGRTGLPALAALLRDAALFIGNDSGPMHLAAAVGTPTVGIFGSSSPAWTAPRGARAISVGPHRVPCAPCFASSCPTERECLTGLEVDAVREAAETLLREQVGRTP